MKTATDISAAIRSGETSARTIAEAALARAASDSFNCFTDILGPRALADADAVDAAIARGEDPGPLAGVPFAVKNLFDVKGLTTRAGSKILRDSPPASADAVAVARLRAAGAVMIGALNMDEFAYGFTTENIHDGPTRNPHDPTRIAGGSSGGSAAAVTAGIVPLTLGTDTNGSIRVPAAFCGVYGLKPTYGRVSRRGVFPFVHDLDHVGLFARTMDDLAAGYSAIAEPAPTSSSVDAPPRIARLGGWFRAMASAEADAATSEVARALDASEIDLPQARIARAAAFCLSAAAGGSLHLDRLRTRPHDFDPATRDRLLAGAVLPAHVTLKAQRYRQVFRQIMAGIFRRTDILIAPATPFAATPIGEPTTLLNGADVPVRANAGLFTQPFSFVGLPVLAAPVAARPGLPLGVQLIAPPWREDRLLALAARLERDGILAAPHPPRARP